VPAPVAAVTAAGRPRAGKHVARGEQRGKGRRVGANRGRSRGRSATRAVFARGKEVAPALTAVNDRAQAAGLRTARDGTAIRD
jgi:hypothetical protein